MRVLRILEYIYPDFESAEDDMSRWAVPPTGTKKVTKGKEIRSAIITAPDFDVEGGVSG